jgi:hypothetical protein
VSESAERVSADKAKVNDRKEFGITPVMRELRLSTKRTVF